MRKLGLVVLVGVSGAAVFLTGAGAAPGAGTGKMYLTLVKSRCSHIVELVGPKK